MSNETPLAPPTASSLYNSTYLGSTVTVGALSIALWPAPVATVPFITLV